MRIEPMFAQSQPISRLQQLAMSLHLARWEDSYLMIGTAYLDASGGKESPALVVAGFLSPTVHWLRFERDWKYCLAWYGVSALHMKHYAHSVGDFSSWKGDEGLRKRFLGDLIRIIKGHVDNSFAVAVHMPDYREVDCEYKLHEWAHPYAVAGVHCMNLIKLWARQYGYDFSLVDYVFESGDEGKGNLFNLASEHLSIDPIFKCKETSVAFEAADLIAYEHYRVNLKLIEKAPGTLDIGGFRRPFQSLVGIPGSMQWAVIQKQELLEHCRRYSVPVRQPTE
jgi:hypothetical protein